MVIADARGPIREVDLVYRHQRLAIEFDGLRVHREPNAMQRDRATDRRMQVVGWRRNVEGLIRGGGSWGWWGKRALGCATPGAHGAHGGWLVARVESAALGCVRRDGSHVEQVAYPAQRRAALAVTATGDGARADAFDQAP